MVKRLLIQVKGTVLLVGTGITTKFALEAKKKLKELNCGVIHYNTIAPFDEQTLLKYFKKMKLN